MKILVTAGVIIAMLIINLIVIIDICKTHDPAKGQRREACISIIETRNHSLWFLGGVDLAILCCLLIYHQCDDWAILFGFISVAIMTLNKGS